MPLAFILQLTLSLETGFRVNGGKTSHVQHFNSEKIDDKEKIRKQNHYLPFTSSR